MQSRTVYHWQSRRDDRAITLRIKEIAETRIRYGCPRIHVLLQREGWLINYKKTHRIYCLEGLNLRRKRPRRHNQCGTPSAASVPDVHRSVLEYGFRVG